jgi:hypothetical protein
MTSPFDAFEPDRRHDGTVSLHLTPAEWRHFLEDRSFLTDEDNRYQTPRRLMGVTVVIVPDHRFG